jgi:hypothetical protein
LSLQNLTADGFIVAGFQMEDEHNFYMHLKKMGKHNTNQSLVKRLTSFNPVAKNLRSRTYKPKVIQSKKLYNRKKVKLYDHNARAKKEQYEI